MQYAIIHIVHLPKIFLKCVPLVLIHIGLITGQSYKFQICGPFEKWELVSVTKIMSVCVNQKCKVCTNRDDSD